MIKNKHIGHCICMCFYVYACIYCVLFGRGFKSLSAHLTREIHCTVSFGGWLYRFIVFQMPLSYLLGISLENITKVKYTHGYGYGRGRTRKTERERERDTHIGASFPLQVTVLFLELFICGRLHRHCKNGDPPI